jgi:hypothetical protein
VLQVSVSIFFLTKTKNNFILLNIIYFLELFFNTTIIKYGKVFPPSTEAMFKFRNNNNPQNVKHRPLRGSINNPQHL